MGANPPASADNPFSNKDMAPVPPEHRSWGFRDMACLWISMAACIPTYMLASGLIAQGMNWWQAIATIFLGNVIVLVPMLINAHAGTKYGIPFPVYCRASFGIRGANVPAMVRAFIACGWFGIQTWIGGHAVYTIAAVFVPSLAQTPEVPGIGKNAAEMGCFLFFWAINVFVICRGIDTIRVLLNVKAPLLVGLGLALLAWAYFTAGGFGEMLSRPSEFGPGAAKEGLFWVVFAVSLTANVSFWATLSLNIPDFSRYARSQKDQALGQAFGLPPTMALYSFIGIAVTSAAFVIYPNESQKDLWDPVFLLSKFQNPIVLVVAMLALCLATLATNIAANVVSPANDFAHLAPRWISFRTGGVITAICGILIQPWRLLENASVYIDTWLVGVSALLGSAGGILLADYLVIRRTSLDVDRLYRRDGQYWYRSGFNPVAIVALAAGIAPCVPGFLAQAKLTVVSPFWTTIYTYAWFVSFGVSASLYLALMIRSRAPQR